MYGKHFASTYTGSMCGAGADVFAVWGYVIANTRGSQVELNPAYLAAVLGMTPEQVSAAIDKLCSPDERSRSQLNEGRRLLREGQFAYHVPNHASYRRMRDEEERREYLRLKKQESRVRQRKETLSTDVNHGQPMSTHSEAEAEAYTEAENLFPVPTNGNGKPKKSPKVDDPRHSQFRAMIEAAYLKVNGVQCPWSGAEGAQLKRTISACPSLDNPTFKKLLLNYFNSEDHPRGDRPSKFLPRIFSYTTVLTKFKTEETNPDACRFE